MKVAEWKTKQSQPCIAEGDPQIVLRRILLNSLMKAPVPKERVIASARRQLASSARMCCGQRCGGTASRRCVMEKSTGASRTYWLPSRVGTMRGQMTEVTKPTARQSEILQTL